MFIGRMTRHEMEEEHPAELALIDQGKDFQPPPPAVLRRRRRIFYPVASVIVIVSGILLLGFITFEKTAIETVPPMMTGEAFVPYTPTPTLPPTQTPTPTMTPTPGAKPSTPEAAAGDSWDTTIGALFNAKCAACHVNASLGNLSLKTYTDALKGGKTGPAIVPNDPDASVLVQVQQKGGHAGQFTPEELDRVIAWINGGAPEQGGAGPAPVATPSATSAINSWADAEAIFVAKCATCHINAQAGNLSLKTYTDTLKGGNSGPAIIPGDPDASVLVKTQQGTSHPAMGMLTPEELAAIIAWIEKGAPEIASEESPASESPSATPTPESGGTTPSGGGEAWTGGIDQLINAKCAGCHVAAAMGSLSLKTYADALKGGKAGPAIVPNDPAKSVLVTVQQKGGHAGQFTPEEIDRIIKWIEAGAPETSGTSGVVSAATPAAATGIKTWAEASAIFTAKCTVCHINSQAGNLSLKTYTDALQGGVSGPAIVPGDPDKSVLVKAQQGTTHPAMGMLTPEELAAIIAWIEGGAPEK
jgi:mono/diheme cytochrome c family protein